MAAVEALPYARIVSIFDLSRCRNSMMGRAVNAESMAAPASSKLNDYYLKSQRISGLIGEAVSKFRWRMNSENASLEVMDFWVVFGVVGGIGPVIRGTGCNAVAFAGRRRQCMVQAPLHAHHGHITVRTGQCELTTFLI